MRRRAARAGALLAAGMLAGAATGAPAAAQALGAPGGEGGPELTLEDAYGIARAHNPAYRQASNELVLNTSEMRSTWLNTVLPRPALTLFSTAYTGNVQRRATDPFGNPIANPEADWVFFSNTTQALTLSWTVQGSNLATALRTQRERNHGRELAEGDALHAVRAAVRRQFYQVQRQAELLELERALEQERRLDLEIAQRLFARAATTRVDVLNAELGIEQQLLSIRQQEAAYEQARLALRTVLGDPDLVAFRLAEEPVPVFDPSGLDTEALVGEALDVNLRVRRAESAERSARLGVREQRDRWWPELNVQYLMARRAQAPERSALFDLSFDEDFDRNFRVGLSLPFFNNYLQSREAQQRAEVQLANSREGARETRLQVEEAVRTAVMRLRNEHESLRLERRSLEIAEEALRLAREEFRLGARSFEELHRTIQQEAAVRRQAIEARYRFMDALIALEEAVGAPVPVPLAAAAGGS